MRNIIVASIITVLITCNAFAGVQQDAEEALVMWQPTSVEFRDDTLNVLLPQAKITEEAYSAVLTTGFCMWTAAGKDLTSVSELVVLNKFGAQGHVSERGAMDCAEINQMPAESMEVKLKILSATRLF
ncbi:hypothetical protein ACFE33_04415 [Falsihalocynthiibacter sp. SS001]|uniref:hypothetical protein n=1 Tax=Falsihalocynthiibacter sp. SS001 TaxID=3349698 RepID=UPI0036D36570